MADSRDITGKNRKFTGTGGIKLPTGSEAQRVDEAGQLRFNTDTNLAEYYDGTDWKPIDAPPTITGFTVDGGSSVTSAEIARISGDATIVIQGSNFDTTSGTVVFEPESGGSNVSVQTITRTSSSSFTITVTRTDFLTANDPYAIKLTNGSGLAATLASAITANDLPAFSTAADTTVASKFEGQSAPFSETTLAATDPEGDTITYSISAGALPPGVTINSSTAALEGTISGSSIQNYTFTVQAATAQGNSTRQFVFAIVVNPFVTATGGTVTTSGDYKIHTFTGDGCFVVSNAGSPPGSTSVDYLVVAGGGAGGSGLPADGGGGGGGGGFRLSNSTSMPGPQTSPLATPTAIPVSVTTYPITVGGGGAENPGAPNTPGGKGNNSVFSTITSAGGGGGDAANSPATPTTNGGSGGGLHQQATGGIGDGNSPPVSPPQGNNGGGIAAYPTGSGGGGAGAVGGQAVASSGVSGGSGSYVVQTGFAGCSGTPGPVSGARYFSGGGAGGGSPGRGYPDIPDGSNDGRFGGAGASGSSPRPGVANTGGGGGAGSDNPAGSGGSGIVIIRYKFQ